MKKAFAFIVKTSLLLLITTLLVSSALSQNKVRKKKMEEIDFYYQYDNFHLALPLLKELYTSDTNDIEVNFKLGVCVVHCEMDVTLAQGYFQKSMNSYADSYYYLGRIYHRLLLLDDALAAFQKYKDSQDDKTITAEVVDHEMKKSVTAKIMIKNERRDVTIRNAGDSINSKYADYVPLISTDESFLLFTSRRKGSTGDEKDPLNKYYEDIYISYNKIGSWSTPMNLGKPINSATHDACVSITQDGKQFYIYRTDKAQTGGDIYLSILLNEKWTEPQILSKEINTLDGLETSACLSPDENTLYFSSNREGGFGGMDLFMVRKLPDGEWGKSINLGSTVNSVWDDDAPIIHPDGKTLYFSSRGHENMGGYDIFKSELKESGAWSVPENMGYPINTVFDDIYFTVTASGRIGYFSSNRTGGFGESDIYSVIMPDNLANRVVLSGTVVTTDPVFSTLKANITIIDYQTKELQGIYRTNKKTGKFLMVLFPQKKYKIIVESDGYYSYTDELDLTKRMGIDDLNRRITLESVNKETLDVMKYDSILPLQDSLQHIDSIINPTPVKDN